MSKLLKGSPEHPQFSESILKHLPHPAFSELPSILKTFPTHNRISPLRGLYHSEVLTSLGSSPL